MMRKFVNIWLPFFVIPFLIDRVTKLLVVWQLVPNQDVTSFLEIYLTYNRGISWGIGSSSSPYHFVLLSALIALVIGAFIWYVRTMQLSKWAYASCLMIMSGALSNFFDRLWYGGVVDFIRFYWNSYSFPVFNMADVFISCGTALLVYFHRVDE